MGQPKAPTQEVLEGPLAESELLSILPELHDDKGNFSLPTAGPASIPPNPKPTDVTSTKAAKGKKEKEFTPEQQASTLIGTTAGAVLSRVPTEPVAANARQIAQAKATSTAKTETVKDISQRIAGLTAEQRALDAQYREAQQVLQQARENAGRLYATPEAAPTGAPSAGDKWSAKVTGSMGPGGEGVTEAARNYRLQQSLDPSEAAQFKTARSGLIVPNTVDTSGPFHTPAQSTAARELEAAQARFNAISQQINQNKSQLAQLQKTLTPVQTKAVEAGAKVKALEGIAPGFVGRLGRVASAIPLGGVIGGGLAGYDLYQAKQDYEQGDYGQALLHGLSGAGGALMAVPHPIAKGVGLGMTAPLLAYEGYKYATEPD
jgi:hypothetical protein